MTIPNNFLVIYSINKLNKCKTERSKSAFNFSTPFMKIPYDKLLQVLHELIDYIFKEIATNIRGNSEGGRVGILRIVPQ